VGDTPCLSTFWAWIEAKRRTSPSPDLDLVFNAVAAQEPPLLRSMAFLGKLSTEHAIFTQRLSMLVTGGLRLGSLCCLRFSGGLLLGEGAAVPLARWERGIAPLRGVEVATVGA